jgi:hypothetical protein
MKIRDIEYIYNFVFSKKHIIACDLKIHIFYVFKLQFFKNAIPKNSYSAIWFKIPLFIYKIAVPKTLLMTLNEQIN